MLEQGGIIMKVAVSATGTELSSQVDPRFGRAEYLLIIDTDSRAIVEVIDNKEATGMAQGAGINLAGRAADAGVQTVITGVVGPKAAAVCEKAGIAMVNGASGTVAEAVEQFLAGPQARTTTQARESGAAVPAGPGRGPGCRGNGMGRGKGAGMGAGMGRGRCRRS